MKFGGIDLSVYGLVARHATPLPYMPPVRTVHMEVGDRAWDYRAHLSPRVIEVDVVITGASRADLETKLDGLSRLLNPSLGLKELVLNWPGDRFFNAKVSAPIAYEWRSSKAVTGSLSFVCPDPLAYALVETQNTYALDVDPKMVYETPGGTARVLPVYRLTPGADLGEREVTLKNLDTGETLVITGMWYHGGDVEIDCPNWRVIPEDHFADVTGQFPRLEPGTSNRIEVTDLGTGGTLRITYRNAYL